MGGETHGEWGKYAQRSYERSLESRNDIPFIFLQTDRWWYTESTFITLSEADLYAIAKLKTQDGSSSSELQDLETHDFKKDHDVYCVRHWNREDWSEVRDVYPADDGAFVASD